MAERALSVTQDPPTNPPESPAEPRGEVLHLLEGLSRAHGQIELSEALSTLRAFAGDDLLAVEEDLDRIPALPNVVGRSLRHLLTLQGKRLRPLCVALAARVGRGGSPEARALASAVELVHSATLLHDDVVDHGTLRRGRPTARALYGNAASVFAGDWLLIEALRRVTQANIPGVMERLLEVIDEMIRAESIQLEARGTLVADRAHYFAVIDGKTAALFRFALWAGARAGGLDGAEADALAAYGGALGLAFQIVDDALDLVGDEAETGKTMFADLREGKLTYPLLLGIEREPELAQPIESMLDNPDAGLDAALSRHVLDVLHRHGALRATLDEARAHAERATRHLGVVPAGPARESLAIVAAAAVNRAR